MRSYLAGLTVLLILGASGCQRGQYDVDQDGVRSRRVVTNSPDPFMSFSYAEDELARPNASYDERQQQQDPFDQFFDEFGTFGDISQPMRTPPPPIPGQTNTNYSQQRYGQGYTQPSATRSPTTSYSTTPSANTSNQQSLIPVSPVTSYAGSSGNLLSVPDTAPHHVSLTYPSPEYGIIKLDKIIPSEVSIDQSFKYTIIITNLTDTALSGIVVSETLDNNFAYESATPIPQEMPNQLMWRVDSLGPKASEQITVYGKPRDITALKHSTTVTYSVVANSNIRVVKPELDLTRKVPSEALICDVFPIEYVVKNVGSGSARDVTINETLPSGLATSNGFGEINFDVGVLRSGEARSFTAELRASRVGVYANKAVATSSSNTKAESAQTATTIRQPVLAITKSGPERQYLGRPLSYEITVVNKGDGVAQNTILEDSIPVDVTTVEASAGADVSGSRLRWELGVLPPNSQKTVRVSYKPNKVGVFTSDTTVTAHCSDTIRSSTRTAVVGIPVVSLDVVDLEDPIEVGGNITFVITATNDGSAPDHNLRVVCQLEDKIQYLSSSGATNATLMGRTLSFSQLRTLAPNTKATWRVVCKAIRAGGVRFKVTLTSDDLTRPVEETEASYLYE